VIPAVVLDASVGVKWLRPEAGSDEADGLLRRHGEGEIQIVLPVVFVHEVLDVARRQRGVATARALLKRLEREEVVIASADPGFLRHVLEVCERFGCSVYDAAAPALAELLDAQLVSADRKAHGEFPGVRIIG
jgi:predicted nucleic acid-binding protein